MIDNTARPAPNTARVLGITIQQLARETMGKTIEVHVLPKDQPVSMLVVGFTVHMGTMQKPSHVELEVRALKALDLNRKQHELMTTTQYLWSYRSLYQRLQDWLAKRVLSMADYYDQLLGTQVHDDLQFPLPVPIEIAHAFGTAKDLKALAVVHAKSREGMVVIEWDDFEALLT